MGVSRVEKSSFDLSRPLGGRLGHYFQVRAKFGCFWADDMVKMKKSRFFVILGTIFNFLKDDFGCLEVDFGRLKGQKSPLNLSRSLEGRLGH